MIKEIEGVEILDTHRSERTGKERNYYLIETRLGKYIFYTMDADNHTTVTYKNLSTGDVFWRCTDMGKFLNTFKFQPIEIFASRRLSFPRQRIAIEADGFTYQLAEPKKKDGFLYEIPASYLRIFPSTTYPDMKFIYTRYNIESMRMLDPMSIERMKTIEVIRFNKSRDFDVHAVSKISEAVYQYVNGLLSKN